MQIPQGLVGLQHCPFLALPGRGQRQGRASLKTTPGGTAGTIPPITESQEALGIHLFSRTAGWVPSPDYYWSNAIDGSPTMNPHASLLSTRRVPRCKLVPGQRKPPGAEMGAPAQHPIRHCRGTL